MWLPWYSGYEDGGAYTDDAWAVFDTLPTLLVGLAALATLIGPLTIAAPGLLRWVRGPCVASAAGITGACVYRVFTSPDQSASAPSVGAFVSVVAGVAIITAWLAADRRAGAGGSEPG